MKVDGIIGLDFLKSYECSLDVVKEILMIQNETILLYCKGFLGCYQSVSTETVSIPRESEIIIQGKVCHSKAQRLPGLKSIVSGDENSRRTDSTLIARTFANVKDDVPVRLIMCTLNRKWLILVQQ